MTLWIDAGGLAADAATLDALARFALLARRHGCAPRLCNASTELAELIEFAGLGQALPSAGVRPGW